MRKYGPFLLLVLISYFAVRAVLTPGYFPMHDDTQVARVVAMGRALREGQFPVRWVSDLGYGYGYPIFNFYGPLPYYAGGALHALGVSGLTATKAMFVLGMVLSGAAMYAAGVSYLGKAGALVAAAFYLYAPYRAVQVYVRGSVGEGWILIFWPLIVWAIIAGRKQGTQVQAIIVGSIGLAGAILSHTLLGYATAYGVGLGLSLYWAWTYLSRSGRLYAFRTHVFVYLLGLGLAAFFWIPAFTESIYTSVNSQIGQTSNYPDHFVCPEQLWNPMQGYGGSAPGCVDGLPLGLGKLHIIAGLAAVLLWRYVSGGKRKAYLYVASVAAAAGIFLVLGVSQPFWDISPRFAYMQYPWRFLALAALGLSMLAGTLLWYVRGRQMRIAGACILLAGVILGNAKWFVPQYHYMPADRIFESDEDIRWRASKISDEYLPRVISRPSRKEEVISDTIAPHEGIFVYTEKETAVYGRYRVVSGQAGIIDINKPVFPGWKVSANGKAVDPDPHRINDGLMHVPVGAGSTLVELRFTDTLPRSAGNAVSLAAVSVLVYLYGKQNKGIG